MCQVKWLIIREFLLRANTVNLSGGVYIRHYLPSIHTHTSWMNICTLPAANRQNNHLMSQWVWFGAKGNKNALIAYMLQLHAQRISQSLHNWLHKTSSLVTHLLNVHYRTCKQVWLVWCVGCSWNPWNVTWGILTQRLTNSAGMLVGRPGGK